MERLAEPVRGDRAVLARSTAGDMNAAEPVVTIPLEERARAALAELAALGVGTKKAAGIVAALTGLPPRRLYALGLEEKRRK